MNLAAVADHADTRMNHEAAGTGPAVPRTKARTFARAAHRHRCLQMLRVNGAIRSEDVRELLAWADSTLAPHARWRRLGGLALTLGVLIFVLFWPFMLVIGATLHFGGTLTIYLLTLAVTAPFAFIGERDKARDVVTTLRRPSLTGPEPTRSVKGAGPMAWGGGIG